MAFVSSYNETDSWISISLLESGREGTYTLSVDDETNEDMYSPKVLEALYSFQRSNDESARLEHLQTLIDDLNVHIADLPHIEDCSEAMQKLYDVMNDPWREDDMLFIEYMDDAEFQDTWGMSKSDFEKQIYNDCEKYNCSSVIDIDDRSPDSEFYDYYACVYPALRDAFTHKEYKELEKDKSESISLQSSKKKGHTFTR